MSDGSADKPSRALVGYRRPPAAHQFTKGKSGNPRGRPRKTKPSKANSGATTQLDDILLAEALRPIQIRENDQVIELPMIQAVLRSLGVAAVKGNHRSQLALAGMVKAVQLQRHQDLLELFKNAVEYKDSWQQAFAEADRRGEPRPEPVPHPDEILINVHRMEVTFNGPMSEDEKAKWDKLLMRRKSALDEVAQLRKSYKRSKYQKYLDDEIAGEERIADIIASIIPDEKTRREPDFDLREWRERQGAMRKLNEKRRAPRAASAVSEA